MWPDIVLSPPVVCAGQWSLGRLGKSGKSVKKEGSHTTHTCSGFLTVLSKGGTASSEIYQAQMAFILPLMALLVEMQLNVTSSGKPHQVEPLALSLYFFLCPLGHC